MSGTSAADPMSAADDDVSGGFRSRVTALLADIYRRHAPGSPVDDLSRETEAGIFEASKDMATAALTTREEVVESDYFHIAAQVVANLDPEAYVGNRNLIGRVVRGEVSARAVGGMDSQDRFPERWAASKARLALEQSQTQRPSMTSDQFQCNRCKGRECTYYQMQTRSADEPITTFIQCTQCHNRWRE